jgi:inhibitor of KinA sporulation pathway (predicted exonuclease)
VGYILTDSEYTAWEGSLERGWSGPNEHREIVQIGSVRTDDDFNIVETFMQLVIPSINPSLSEFFQSLTNISQGRLESGGCYFAEGLRRFANFCGTTPIICMSGDSGVWRENCKLNEEAFPFEMDFHRLRPFLVEIGIDLQGLSSGDLHTLTDTPLQGHVHDALHDAKSMAIWLNYAKREGWFTRIEQLPTIVPDIDPRVGGGF